MSRIPKGSMNWVELIIGTMGHFLNKAHFFYAANGVNIQTKNKIVLVIWKRKKKKRSGFQDIKSAYSFSFVFPGCAGRG